MFGGKMLMCLKLSLTKKAMGMEMDAMLMSYRLIIHPFINLRYFLIMKNYMHTWLILKV
jgi:hypothetical protein